MLQSGDRVLVTGATGFIGSAVARALVSDGCQVVATVEPGADERNLDGLEVERQTVDIRDAAAVRKAVDGCRAVFHVAALYRFWSRNPHDFYAINVEGTRHVLAAAKETGTERLVCTSTVGTLGLDGAETGTPADETCYPDVSHLFGSYKRSKYVAEHEVLRAAAEGLAVSLVMPTFPLGPYDRTPTPTGSLILDFLNGRIPAYVDTVLNVVHVDDVARGHILALEKGAVGRGYILGGENLTLKELLGELARCSGLRAPTVQIPRAISLSAAWLSDTIEGRLLRRPPHVPLEAAKMSTTKMSFDNTRAREELGFAPRPAAEALEASARWFVDGGYVSDRRRAKITWAASASS
jgi:dihydroflavonol-4-reductase